MSTLTDEIVKLERERDRAVERWHEERSRASELQGRVSKLEGLVNIMGKLETNLEEAKRSARRWREMCLYEQKLKKPQRQPRHVPGSQSLFRAKFKNDDYPNAERVFLKHWRKENKRVAGLNGGNGVLELILSADSNSGPADITQRDATVAATVIQWLGTNCGMSFLMECEREVAGLKAKMDEIRIGRWQQKMAES